MSVAFNMRQNLMKLEGVGEHSALIFLSYVFAPLGL